MEYHRYKDSYANNQWKLWGRRSYNSLQLLDLKSQLNIQTEDPNHLRKQIQYDDYNYEFVKERR